MKTGKAYIPTERQFHALIENARGVNTLLDEKGVIRYISPSCKRILGRDAEEFIGNTRFDYLVEEDRPVLAKAVEILSAQPGASVTVKLRWIRSDGEIRDLDCKFQNLLHDPSVSAVVGNCSDHTELNKRTDEINRSRLNFKAVLDNSNDVICSVGRDGRLITVNAGLKKIFHGIYHAEIEEGTDLMKCVPAAELEFWGGAYARGFQGEKVVLERQYAPEYGGALVEFTLTPIFEGNIVTSVAVFGRDITKQREALQEIQFQANLLAQTGDVIVAADREGLVTYWNAAAERRFRIPADQAIGKQGRSFFEGWTCVDSFEKIGHDIAAKGIWNGIFRFIGPEGLTGAFSMTVYPLMHGDTYTGSLWISHDITKDELMEQELVESEVRYQQLFEESPLPMWVIDIDSLRFLNVNRAACELYGYSEREFLGMTIPEIRIPKDRAFFMASIVPLIRDSLKEVPVLAQHMKKNGQEIDVLVRNHMIQFEGRSARMALLEDVTERLKTEHELFLANERFQLASEAVSSVIYDWDVASGRCIDSRGLSPLTGFDQSVDAGIDTLDWWMSRIHHEDLPNVQKIISNALAQGSSYEAEYRMLHREGYYVYVWDHGIIQRDASGNAIRVVGSTQDITNRKRMEALLEQERNNAMLAKDKAEEMTRLKTSFLANMSHEIRTPMTAILGFAEILKDKIDDEVLSQQAAIIETSAKRLLGTINTILDHAITESKSINLTPSHVGINEEVKQICTLIEPLATGRNLTLNFYPSVEPFEAFIDARHFGHLVTNLVGNAIKFTNEGEVNVHVRSGAELDKPVPLAPGFESYRIGKQPEGACFRIIVEDTGLGVAGNNLPVIFEEFKQVSTGYQRNFEGNGLGLTITGRFVEAMGGSIEVQSACNVGSKFIVCLPQNLDIVPSDGVLDTQESTPQPKVLIIEDSFETVKLVSAQLEDRVELIHASTVPAARQVVKDIFPDLILMDINLGEFTTGLHLTREFRRDKKLANVPIIALTAYARKSDRKAAFEAGCTDFLTKPFSRIQLLEIVDRYLGVEVNISPSFSTN